MSLFDNRDFETKSTYGFLFEGKKEEPELEPEAELEDEDAADKDAEKIEEGAIYECVGCPAIADAKEDNEFFTLEAMAIVTALGSKEEACTEAYATATSYNQKVAVTESFKENIKKYWERFKGFLGRVRNMIVRVAQRFMGYIKRLIARLQAKWASRDGSKDDIMDAWKDKKEDLKDVTVEIHGKILSTPIDEARLANLENSAREKDGKYIDIANVANNIIKNLSESKDARKEMEDYLDDIDVPSASDIIDDVLGDTVEVHVSSLNPKALISDLKNVNKAFKNIDKARKNVTKLIDKVEGSVKKVINKKSEVIGLFVKLVNKIVATYNAILSAFNQYAVIWVRDRIKVLNAIKNA